MSFEFLNQLPTPADIKRDYPCLLYTSDAADE